VIWSGLWEAHKHGKNPRRRSWESIHYSIFRFSIWTPILWGQSSFGKRRSSVPTLAQLANMLWSGGKIVAHHNIVNITRVYVYSICWLPNFPSSFSASVCRASWFLHISFFSHLHLPSLWGLGFNPSSLGSFWFPNLIILPSPMIPLISKSLILGLRVPAFTSPLSFISYRFGSGLRTPFSDFIIFLCFRRLEFHRSVNSFINVMSFVGTHNQVIFMILLRCWSVQVVFGTYFADIWADFLFHTIH